MHTLALISMLLFASSIEIESKNHDGTSVVNHCSNDSTCPTWFTCNAEKQCHCDSGHPAAILCDNEAQLSAILNYNCITYDSESKFTYVGACFLWPHTLSDVLCIWHRCTDNFTDSND